MFRNNSCTLGLNDSVCKDNDVSSTVDTKAFNLEKNMDTSYLPGDNFYMYGNGTWYNNTTVGTPDQMYAGMEYDAKMKLMQNLKSIFSTNGNGKIFLADLANMNNTAAAAVKSIVAHIHEFDAISTAAEAWAAIGKAKKMGYNPLIDLITYMKGGTVRLLYTWPLQSKLTEDVSATSSYLTALGYSVEEATAIANSAKAAKDALASAYSYTNYTDDNLQYYPTLNNKLIPIGELSTNGGGMDVVNAISSTLSIDNSSNVYIPNDIGNYLDALHALTPEQIKHVIQCELAQDYVYSSLTVLNQLNKNGATYTPESLWGECIGGNDLNYFSSVLYTKSVVTDALKEEITQVAEDFRTALKTKINSLEWMSSATKARAIEKLEAMKFWIGKPDKWDETYMPTLTGTSLVEDLRLIKASKFALSMSLKGASKSERGMEFEISQGVNLASVNSCYDPYLNAMLIYPSYILPPYHDPSYSDAYMSKLQLEGYCGDELVKQEKKFFLGACNLRRAKFPVFIIQRMLNSKDVHSMHKERVNGMVINTDRWYELFNVTKDNKLYLPKEKRADIW